MKRTIEIKGHIFEVGNYTPRNNKFERGLKYKLYCDGYPTSYCFSTIKEALQFALDNWIRWDF